MIVDASALVAILRREPEADQLRESLIGARRRFTHAVSAFEAGLAIARLAGSAVEPARAVVDEFLADLSVDIVPIGPAEATGALAAYARYGKGRHPARLNMGDCFSYAVAKVRGMPLLYKGEDFALTDLA